jgi:hypothetical protein
MSAPLISRRSLLEKTSFPLNERWAPLSMTSVPLLSDKPARQLECRAFKKRAYLLSLIHLLVNSREILLESRRQRVTVKDSLLNLKEVLVSERDSLVSDDLTQRAAKGSCVIAKRASRA